MKEDLTCNLCTKTFKFQFAREVHFDIVHNFCMYMCKLCEKVKDPDQKDSKDSYCELLDHSYSFHESNPYIILKYLNIF